MWEHSAVLTDQQQAALDVISSACGQRPMPTQLAAARGPAPDATPLPPTPLEPMSPGASEAAEASFVGTSFEDVTLQASGAGALESAAAAGAGCLRAWQAGGRPPQPTAVGERR